MRDVDAPCQTEARRNREKNNEFKEDHQTLATPKTNREELEMKRVKKQTEVSQPKRLLEK